MSSLSACMARRVRNEGQQAGGVDLDQPVLSAGIWSPAAADPGASPASLGETDTLRSMKTQRLADGTVHKLPADFRKAIESNAATRSLWSEITPLARNEWICWVTSAKQDTTRKRRIEVGLDKMRGGMRRPCCWPGCPHR